MGRVAGVLLGALRLVAVLVLLVVGTAAVLLAVLWPARVGGVRPALWPAVGLCRAFVALMGVRVVCPDPDAIRRHHGLVFFNHLSYLDVVVLLALGPMRFLSAEGVRRLPLVGPMATSVGTVFVRRGDADSRAASRVQLVGKLRARPFPPLALAPEGQISHTGAVLPFRRGAFEVAAEAGVPIRPVALRYSPLAPVVWRKGEWLLQAVARLATHLPGVAATVMPLPVVTPTPSDDPGILASSMEAAMKQAGEAQADAPSS